MNAKRRRDIAPIRSLLDSMVGRMDPEGRRYESEVVAAWARVCGDDIAAHTIGHSFREGELLVLVDTAVWANELSLMAEEMRRRLREAVPQVSVTSIRFVVSRRVSEAAREQGEELRASSAPGVGVASQPLSDAELAAIAEASSDIADPDLRAAAEALMRRDLEWKKGLERRSSSNDSQAPETDGKNR